MCTKMIIFPYSPPATQNFVARLQVSEQHVPVEETNQLNNNNNRYVKIIIGLK